MEKKFEQAVALWREWNGRINVVSRQDIEHLYEHHVLHSLAIAAYLRRFYPQPDAVGAGTLFLDLGTGGGFPGIPLAIALPVCRFLLCDSVGKKIKVAQAVAQGIGLDNVRCVQARAEDLPGPFDWVVSRAVTSLPQFYPWVKGKFRRGILCLKGGDVEAEIAELGRRCGVPRGCVRVWPVTEWLKDDYFKEKFVIEIGKSYLCPPKID